VSVVSVSVSVEGKEKDRVRSCDGWRRDKFLLRGAVSVVLVSSSVRV
jgi:hypothetical protein